MIAKPSYSQQMKTILLTLLVIFSVSICLAQEPYPLSDGSKAISAIVVNRSFEENELAMEKYVGKPAAIYGRLEKVGRDKDGAPYALIFSGGTWEVKCIFTDKDAATLAAAKTGVCTFIRGVLRGKTNGRGVELTGCVILNVK